jgi:phytoene synthase
MTPDDYCQQKAAQSGSSFYYSFLFLPPDRRRAITAFYAFCREVDDVVDEMRDPGVAQAKLDWWREQVQRLQHSLPTQHPVTQALQPFMRTFELDPQHLQLIIDGMQMDLEQKRYFDFDSLRKYCYHVAGVVGLVSARIFGATQAQTLQYAETLGLAFQLTNILRDIGEDARHGRFYLPEQDLERYGVTREQLVRGEANEAFRALMQFEAERAREFYRQALALLPVADKRAQRPGLIMAAIYRTLLDEIERADFPVLTHRVSLTPLRKFWLAWRTWVWA